MARIKIENMFIKNLTGLISMFVMNLFAGAAKGKL